MADYLQGLFQTTGRQYYQLSVPHLVEAALHRNEGVLAANGSLVVTTGKYTGRSPQDRFIVDVPAIHHHVDWGSVNLPISENVFNRVLSRMTSYLAEKDLFIFDGFAGADQHYALSIRFINEYAHQSLFAHQLFRRPEKDQLQDFHPEFTVICAPGLELNPTTEGTHSEAAIILHLERKMVLIAGTHYCGEIKKSIFSAMNYLMPDRHVFPMHCSANVGADGRSALFFGLSGTGKTTLSADPERTLIGDDEHGWADTGIFNFEGGCYAKTIRLSKENEPEIWDAIQFGALCENVVINPDTRIPDYNDASLTENGRVGYPIDFIHNADPKGVAPHPSAIIFLTADAFGVLPPISKLSEEQAQYHFISGYTSKIAGTERGIVEPVAAFSTCFGAPFMPRPSSVYAQLLKERITEHKVNVYLINTGWQGGPYGIGKRISIPHTRAMVTAALEGTLEQQEYWTHPVFNIMVPKACPGVPAEILDPRNSWANPVEYDAMATKLAIMFIENFRKFNGVEHLEKVGPRVPVVS